MRLAVAAIVTAVAALASAPAVASSDVVIHAEPGLRYSPAHLTIAQGQHVVLENDDSTSHNVTSNDYAPDGSRLFRSATIGPGSTPVSGTEYLTTGDYDFFCSVHRAMRGSLTVTTEGTPVPRPQVPDTTRPGLKLSLLTRSAHTALLRRALLVHVRSTERVRVRMVARARGHRIAAGRVVIPKAAFRGARLLLTRAGRKLLRKAAKITVSVRGRAVDRAGNRRRARTRGTLFG